MRKIATRIVATPLSDLRLVATERGIVKAEFVESFEGPSKSRRPSPAAQRRGGATCILSGEDHLDQAARELGEYFAGTRKTFTVALDPDGTEFQREVWTKLSHIPFGTTTTYKQIATAVGRPRGSQAVGLANGSNPIAIIVPCHRVVGSSGKLTGYAGGIERKQWLLAHESATLF